MKKQLPALLAALLMTGVITLVMFVTSANALFNNNGTDLKSSTSSSSNAASSASQVQIQQLQSRVNEYAQREQLYQQREQQYQQALLTNQQKIQQASDQVLQIKQLLFELQARGLIQVQGNGTIMITGRAGN